ncbi:MAG: hypothetical protein PGN08_04685 [Sphingomonas taxi]
MTIGKAGLILCFLFVATQVAAQNRGTTITRDSAQQAADPQEQPIPPPVIYRAGRTADTSVGEVGQRQDHGQTIAGTKPSMRIAGRLQTRVQNRLRNRIDRNYDPTANASNPFAVAETEAQAPARRR